MKPFKEWFQQLVLSAARSSTPTEHQQLESAADSSEPSSAGKLVSLQDRLHPQLASFLQRTGSSSSSTNTHGQSAPCAASQSSIQISRHNCKCSGRDAPSSWRQHLPRSADRLSLKSVLDMNSGLCTAELAWQVQVDQQPARLAVKLSNRQATRASYDVQVALRSPTHTLRLAGSPQGIHSASLVVKPLMAAGHCGSSSSSCDAGANCRYNMPAGNAAGPSTASGGQSSQQQALAKPMHSSRRGRMTSDRMAKRPRLRRPVDRNGAGSVASAVHSRQAADAQLQRAADAAGCHGAGSSTSQPESAASNIHKSRQTAVAAAGRHTPVAARPGRDQLAAEQPPGAATQLQLQSVAGGPTDTTGVQWELGWNFKAGGPIAAMTRQLDASATTSTLGLPAVQQVKVAYDAKAHCVSCTAGGAGWNAALVWPTKGRGLAGLVPRMGQAGCHPKFTFSLVPELTCF